MILFFTNSSIDISLDLDSYKEIDSYEGVTTNLFYEVMSGDDDSACFLFSGFKLDVGNNLFLLREKLIHV